MSKCNIRFDHDFTKSEDRYKLITADWQLLKTPDYWALIHRAYGCNGYVAGSLQDTAPKYKNCSGCGRKVGKFLLDKIPFLVKMDLVNKAWRPDAGSSNGSD